MGLNDIIRSGVAVIDNVTATLQDTVTHEAWIGHDSYGADVFASPINRQALVEMTRRITRDKDGQVIMENAQVIFIRPIPANGTVDRKEPIDPRDRITLPNGYLGPIVNIAGLVDPSSRYPYLYQVSLG